jgi:hypothetical protein
VAAPKFGCGRYACPNEFVCEPVELSNANVVGSARLAL